MKEIIKASEEFEKAVKKLSESAEEAIENMFKDLNELEEKRLTPIEYLKSYLGVVDGDKFDVYENGGLVNSKPYYFRENKILYDGFEEGDMILNGLVTGKYTIKKYPFVPEYLEDYFYIENNGEICRTKNRYWNIDLARIKCDWVFRTEEEAEANKERVMKEMREVMKND